MMPNIQLYHRALGARPLSLFVALLPVLSCGGSDAASSRNTTTRPRPGDTQQYAGDLGGAIQGTGDHDGGETDLAIYNGESALFSQGGAWDSNGSTISESSDAPHSGTHHLRAGLNVVGWWGAVAYAPSAWEALDWSAYANLNFFAKADTAVQLQVWLYDADSAQSTAATSVSLTSTYAEHSVDLASLGQGVDLSRITAIVFSIGVGVEAGTFIVDVDDLAIAAAGPSPAGVVQADDPHVVYTGRWDRLNPAAPKASFGGVTARMKFTGTSCGVRLADGDNNWSYSIDGDTHQTLRTTAAESYTLATGLSSGVHELLMVRRTEAYFGNSTFKGFTIDEGAQTLEITGLPTRRMEFLGDSITAGYGNEGASQSRDTQNVHEAFGPKTARALSASWHVEAISGIGMYRNLGDASQPSELALPHYYQRTLTYSATPVWDPSRWIPDVVVVALGTNDYLSRGSQALDRAAFRAAYSAFLATLRGNYPVAHIFCLSPFVFGGAHVNARADIEQVVTAASDSMIYHLDPVGDVAGADNTTAGQWLDAAGGADYIGDWTHPTVAGHERISARLVTEVRSKVGW